MKPRAAVRYFPLLAACLVAGCAIHRAVESDEAMQRNRKVDQHLLVPEGGTGGAGSVSRYTMSPLEVFRMPLPQQAAMPTLPEDSPRQALAPTTVCARLVLDAQGVVQRAEPVVDHTQCGAGAAPENADLVQAMLAAVQQWRFEPAAVCTFAPTQPPPQPDRCDGAQRIEPVPVTLLYGFTFVVEQGRTRVQGGGMPPR